MGIRSLLGFTAISIATALLFVGVVLSSIDANDGINERVDCYDERNHKVEGEVCINEFQNEKEVMLIGLAVLLMFVGGFVLIINDKWNWKEE